METKYQNYLRDLGPIIKERAMEAKSARDEAARGTDTYTFEAGRVLAFNEAISILQQQALGFDIALEELGLDDIEPDTDLT